MAAGHGNVGQSVLAPLDRNISTTIGWLDWTLIHDPLRGSEFVVNLFRNFKTFKLFNLLK